MKIRIFFYNAIIKLVELISGIFLYNRNLTIITGSDSSHFYSMLQLVNSVRITNNTRTKIICYDLGLSASQLEKFTEIFPGILLKKFNYSLYPEYYNIKVNAGEYAWKSAIIKDEYNLISPNNFILWLDAGCFVKKEFNLIKFTLFFYDIFSPPSKGTINEMTHSSTIQKMNMESYKSLPMLSGGIIGLKRTSKNDSLVNDWSFFSGQKEIISPIGSNRSNHRQDQSIFSLLFYKSYKFGKLYWIINKQWEILAHKDIG
jgi:hypothetical protein